VGQSEAVEQRLLDFLDSRPVIAGYLPVQPFEDGDRFCGLAGAQQLGGELELELDPGCGVGWKRLLPHGRHAERAHHRILVPIAPLGERIESLDHR
jgi:hypothetical protein